MLSSFNEWVCRKAGSFCYYTVSISTHLETENCCKQVKVKVGETADFPLTFREHLTSLHFVSLTQMFAYTDNNGFVIVDLMLSM